MKKLIDIVTKTALIAGISLGLANAVQAHEYDKHNTKHNAPQTIVVSDPGVKDELYRMRAEQNRRDYWSDDGSVQLQPTPTNEKWMTDAKRDYDTAVGLYNSRYCSPASDVSKKFLDKQKVYSAWNLIREAFQEYEHKPHANGCAYYFSGKKEPAQWIKNFKKIEKLIKEIEIAENKYKELADKQ